MTSPSTTSSDSCCCSLRPICSYPNARGGDTNRPSQAPYFILAQILVLVAALCSTWAILDCRYITVWHGDVDPTLNQIVPPSKQQFSSNARERGLGFFYFENYDGTCSWDRDSNFDAYKNFMGTEFDAPRRAAIAAVVLGWGFVVWVALFSCVSQSIILQRILGGLLIVVMTFTQGMAMAVQSTEFCEVLECEISRSAHYGLAAIFLYAFAGGIVLLLASVTRTNRSDDNVDSNEKVAEVAP